jgi:hypothetical protein
VIEVAEVADRMKRVMDPVVAGGGVPPTLSIQMCVNVADDDHVEAMTVAVRAFKDMAHNAGIQGVRIRNVAIVPDPSPDLAEGDEPAELIAATGRN